MNSVSYSIGGRTILRNFDLQLMPGVNRTILGVSGVGKTTILKLILGLIRPDSGTISIDGTAISSLSESQLTLARKHIAIVFQGGALFDSMTVGENVGYRLIEEGLLPADKIEAIVKEKLGFVGLEKTIDLYPAELSGGMKKRVAIARALAADPRYIFFDEPTTGLDPIGVYNIQQLMLRLQEQGKTTLMVTHDMPTAFAVSDRFSFIHNAELVFDGVKDALESSEIPAVREFFAPGRSSLFTYIEEQVEV
ncbi:MAG: ATP-binding cassette domain-containing protein [Geobacteraceae bacterium]|nr:ATP-binding cassette domain-containing protein [Geobacteraceae bacterium]